MPGLKHIGFLLDNGYRFILGLHRFYSFVERFPLLSPLDLLLFFVLFPGSYISFWITNLYMGYILRKELKIDFKNYVFMKEQLKRQEEYVKYFHTFSNADKKSISWFMRPLFPRIKTHIDLQIEFRNLFQRKLLELNPSLSGNRFVLLKESTLWETRTKTYQYLA